MIATKERLNKASTTLATMLDYLGLNATVKGEEKNGKMTLLASSDNAGRIIGKKGQALQGLELLINRMVTKNDIECPWISIDVDGYSKETSSRYTGGPPNRRGNFSDRRRTSSSRGNSRGFKSEEFSENIKEQALDATKEVKRWGEPVTLKPMNSHDRRIVHMTLKEDNEIKTDSAATDSSGRLKSVVISLNEKA